MKSDGIFTIFALSNATFAKLPASRVETLLKTEKKATLVRILTYQVVIGHIDATSVMVAIKAGKGKAVPKTAQDVVFTGFFDQGIVKLTDEKGNSVF